ncbi:lysozyme [Aeromonas phage phiA014L]|uniref:Endolysin n=1 Tax=Aeromonas phage phiA014L TaxID=3119844 RepID=A0ABZ2CQT4_9CAUD
MSAIQKSVVGCSVAAALGLVASLFPNELRTSPEGLALIGKWESCTLTAYRDIVQVPTIGIGSTKGVCMGQVIDLKEVAYRFKEDVKEAEQCVDRWFNGKRMPGPVFDATVSLVYNNGCYGTRWNKRANRATQIASYASKQNWDRVCYHLGDFINAGGKPSKGLINRRTGEQAWCLTGVRY